HQFVVLDHEYGFGAALDLTLQVRLGIRRDAAARRQIHAHRRALAFFAVDLDMACRLLDEAVDHGETEPRALARALRGEERIEHPVEDRRRDAITGVAHGDHDMAAGPAII